MSLALIKLPPPLLALVASNLPVVSLLRLQRCSSQLHRLRADESYMTVAWRHSTLSLNAGTPLVDWTVPDAQCVWHDGLAPSIPIDLWDAAVPALALAAAEREQFDKESQHNRRYVATPRQQLQQFRQLVERPLPTRWILAMRDEEGRLWEVKGEEWCWTSGLERVEVLRNFNKAHLRAKYASVHDSVQETRCRLVLQACPYLHSLDLLVGDSFNGRISHEDTFSLLPRLHSLSLARHNETGGVNSSLRQPPVDIDRMLTSLPHLTSLDCRVGVFLGMSHLLTLAAYCTLEALRIDTGLLQLGDAPWLGDEIRFPLSEDDDYELLRRAAGAAVVSDRRGVRHVVTIHDHSDLQRWGEFGAEKGLEEEVVLGKEEEPLTWTRADTARLHASLTRTQPTQRSCEARLALADWLHRRLMRASLLTGQQSFQPWLLSHRRKQVQLLRCVLQRQLSELGVEAANKREPLARQIRPAIVDESPDEFNLLRDLKQLQADLHSSTAQSDERVEQVGEGPSASGAEHIRTAQQLELTIRRLEERTEHKQAASDEAAVGHVHACVWCLLCSACHVQTVVQ